jgi:radical SAM superfamily enzyme YgiQ (UPF0313 family)
VVGGPHPSGFRGKVLEDCAAIDYLVIGEGEETTPELLEAIASGATAAELARVRGISFRDGDRVVVTEPRPPIRDVDAIPFPALDLATPIGRYPGVYPPTITPSLHVMTSRGCPFSCSFCSNPVWGRGVRFQSVPRVLLELRHAIERHGLREVYLMDDTLNCPKRRAKEIFRGIVREGLHRRTRFRVLFRANERLVDQELLDLAARANVWLIFYGVESGSARINERIHKQMDLGEIENVLAATHRAGIQSICSFMIGNLGEDRKSIAETVEFAKRLAPHYYDFPVATPLPGTPFHEEAERRGLIKVRDLHEYTFQQAVSETEHLRREEITDLRGRAFRAMEAHYGSELLQRQRAAELADAGYDPRTAETTGALEVIERRRGGAPRLRRTRWTSGACGPRSRSGATTSRASGAAGTDPRERARRPSAGWGGSAASTCRRTPTRGSSSSSSPTCRRGFPSPRRSPSTTTARPRGLRAGRPGAPHDRHRRAGIGRRGRSRGESTSSRTRPTVRPTGSPGTAIGGNWRSASYRVRTSGASVALGRSEGDVPRDPTSARRRRSSTDAPRCAGSARGVATVTARACRSETVPARSRDVVVRRGAGVEGDVSLRYRDDGEGSFEVTVLDATLRATHRRRVRLEGSGRVRAARLPWPGDAPAACLVVEPHGVEPAVVSVETVRRDPARVNLGCGSDHRPGMVNLDFRALDGVDVRADVTRPALGVGNRRRASSPTTSSSTSLGPEAAAVVAEWVRVLRPGGTITIRTPSLEGVLRLYRERPTGWGRDEGEIDPIVVRLFGGQEYPGNFHHAIFDLRSLQALLEEAGLGILELGFDGEDVSNLVAVAAKPAPERAPAVGEPARLIARGGRGRDLIV